MEYFKVNNLQGNNQVGFIKGWPVNMQIINLLDKWTKHLDINNNNDIGVTYTRSKIKRSMVLTTCQHTYVDR